jgi:hypothetical protein
MMTPRKAWLAGFCIAFAPMPPYRIVTGMLAVASLSFAVAATDIGIVFSAPWNKASVNLIISL